MRAIALVVLGSLATLAPALAAQRPGQPARGENRQLLEQRVRARFAEIVRQRVGLSEPQMARLERTNRTFEARRRELFTTERDIRRELRSQVSAGDGANQQRVAELLERLLAVQRERVAVLEAEQRELATFMSPVQRARYLGVQDQLRRFMEETRRRRQQEGDARGGRAPRR